MFSVGSAQYGEVFSGQVLLNLLIGNAFVLAVAAGMTYAVPQRRITGRRRASGP